jgi:hypothetical protein
MQPSRSDDGFHFVQPILRAEAAKALQALLKRQREPLLGTESDMNAVRIGFSLLVAIVSAGAARSASATSDQLYSSNAARLESAQNSSDDDNGSDVVVPPIRRGQTPGAGVGQTPGPGQVNRPVLPPNGQLGNICYISPRDGAAGPYAPVGSPCFVTLPNGTQVPGNIGVAGQLPPVLPMPGAR